VVLDSFLKFSKHCVKLAAATKEENNRRSKRIRVGIGCMPSGGENGGGGRVSLKRATLLVFIQSEVQTRLSDMTVECE